MMNKREFLVLLAGAMTASRGLRAQQQKAMPVIGFLSGASPAPSAPYLAAFLQGLSETGYVEGQNVTIDTAGRRAAMIGCPHWPRSSSSGRST
jgi:putative ABC transport system substrate-binding protein